MPAMRSLVAALTLLCCSLLAGSAPAKPLGPDYEKLKALLPPGQMPPFALREPMTRGTSRSTRSRE